MAGNPRAFCQVSLSVCWCIYTAGWREASAVRVNFAQEHNTYTGDPSRARTVRVEPGPLDLESGALTTRSPRLSLNSVKAS